MAAFFNFLKEGLLLPSHNRRLFAALYTIVVVSSCLLAFGNDLAVQIFRVLIRSAIQIVVLSAAVATYSGELHTFGSLLGKVKRQLKGPVLTLALVQALEVAYFKLLGAMSELLMFLVTMKYYWLSTVVSVLVVVPFPFIYLVSSMFLCPLGVVVAVAEPGRRHGTAALGRAWRLVKGKRGRAMLFIFVTAALTFALARVYNLAKRWEQLTSMAGGLLLEFLYSILTSAVQLFEACAMAAFYYECKAREH